jgi:hypothetical protein
MNVNTLSILAKIQLENSQLKNAGTSADFKYMIKLMKSYIKLSNQESINNTFKKNIAALEILQKKIVHFRKTGEFKP